VAGGARLPVVILLDHVRSMYNVGAFFRTADAVGLERLVLCGITAHPPQDGIAKTALGAENSVPWEYHTDALVALRMLRARGCEIAAIETGEGAVDLFDWKPRWPVCVLFGNEVDGLSEGLMECCDRHVRLPMVGAKRSLNVATAGGVVAYELLRKHRQSKEHEGL
jgi:23S rRNA (guanosine2251-2'-O)-methyltransferase